MDLVVICGASVFIFLLGLSASRGPERRPGLRSGTHRRLHSVTVGILVLAVTGFTAATVAFMLWVMVPSPQARGTDQVSPLPPAAAPGPPPSPATSEAGGR